jgi:uncharacterized protein YdeI (YjbR/CyaY-like superfamily)
MNPKVDLYFADGCGRCPLKATPQCKVNSWQEEMRLLRNILLGTSLTEEIKWGVPCYTFEKGNVIILSAFKEYCSLSFFKGALLNDPIGILEKHGENTQAGRLIKFTHVQEIIDLEPVLKSYIHEAIEVEKAGLKVVLKKNPEPFPEEFQDVLDEDPALGMAFDALTPGRQRGYILHFSAPKQSKTRTARVIKCVSKILEGKGLNDR